MKQIKSKIVSFISIAIISGCATTDSGNLTTALSDGVGAGMASMDKNSSKKGSANIKNALVDGVQVGLKSALDDNSSKGEKSGSMTTTVIDGVADKLRDK